MIEFNKLGDFEDVSNSLEAEKTSLYHLNNKIALSFKVLFNKGSAQNANTGSDTFAYKEPNLQSVTYICFPCWPRKMLGKTSRAHKRPLT